MTARPYSVLPKLVFGAGLFRTLTCGGWTYVTSSDDHHWHDIFMISYIVATLPWSLGCLALSPPNPKAIRYRKILAGVFFGNLVPLVYFFIQHKVHRIAGGPFDLHSWRHQYANASQPTPSTPSLSGMQCWSMLPLMRSLIWTLTPLNWWSRTSRD